MKASIKMLKYFLNNYELTLWIFSQLFLTNDGKSIWAVPSALSDIALTMQNQLCSNNKQLANLLHLPFQHTMRQSYQLCDFLFYIVYELISCRNCSNKNICIFYMFCSIFNLFYYLYCTWNFNYIYSWNQSKRVS